MDPITIGLLGGAGGGLLKGIGGMINANDQADADAQTVQAYIDSIKGSQQPIEDAYAAQKGMWGGYANSAPKAMQGYQDALNDNYWKQDPQAFQFDKRMEDYIDPALQYMIKQGVRGLDESAASQGGLFSSGQGRSVVRYAQDESQKENVRAQDRYRQDKGDAYKQYSDFINNQLQRRQTQLTGMQGNANLQMQGLDKFSEARNNYDTSKIQNQADLTNAYGKQKALQQQNENSGWSNFFNALGSAGTGVANAYSAGG